MPRETKEALSARVRKIVAGLKKAYPDAVLIFLIAPPEVFRDRLEHRPSKLTGDALREEIEIRMQTARVGDAREAMGKLLAPDVAGQRR